MPSSNTPATAEHARLAEATGRAEDDLFSANPWYEWGPYLSERAWGTVREDYSASGERYERSGDDLRDGLYVALDPWSWHLFDVTSLDFPED